MREFRQNRPTRPPQAISGLIDKVIGSMAQARAVNGCRIIGEWPQIVGETLAQRSKAVRFEDGVLYIAVPDATWRQEMSMNMDEILRKIQQYPYGAVVKRLRLCMR